MDNTDRRQVLEEEDIGRLLRAAGPREQLPEDLKGRWEQHFRQELQDVQARRSGRQWKFFAGIAAGLALLAVSLSLFITPSKPTAPLVRVATVSGSVQASAGGSDSAAPLAAGESLEQDSEIRTGANGFVALAWAGYDLRLNRDTRLSLAPDGVFLLSGEIYVSDAPRRIGKIQLVVNTPHGRIRDIGTQFRIAVRPDSTVTTVRRGIVELNTDSTEHRAEAQAGLASRVTVDNERQVHTEQVAPSGDEWEWIYRAAPAYTLDGESAWDFLQWSTGQSGQTLKFATAAAEVYARTTTLHGSIEKMDPESAIGPVLATTDLTAVVENGKLLVSLRH